MNSLLYLATVFIWGSSWFAIKFQLGIVPPELSVAYRFGLASIILLLFIFIRKKRLHFPLKEHRFFLLQGTMLFSISYLLIYMGSAYLTSGLVSILFSCIVLLNIFFSSLIFKKPLERKVLAGALAGISGLVVIFYPELKSAGFSGGTMKGFLIILLATSIASLGNITSARNQKHGLPVLQTNAFSMGYGSLIMLSWSLIQGKSFVFDFSSGYVLSLAYLSIFASILAFGAYLTLLGKIGPEKAGYASVLFPAIALLWSALFESFHITPSLITGFLMVLAGNVLVLTPKKWFQRRLTARSV